MTVPVFADYDQSALDAQYNNRARVDNYQEYFDRWDERSARTRSTLACELDVAFGESSSEQLDIFPAAQRNAPVCMFIHGGYWQSLDKSMFSFVAEALVANGVACVVNNYGLCPDIGMDEIVLQNCAAVAWVHANAASFGADPRRVHVCGHSAGGHLVAMLFVTDWPRQIPGAPPDLIKSGCAVSGLYDLEPIRLSYLNETLGMDTEVARRNSPMRLPYPEAGPLVVAVGGAESAEFLRQASEMAVHWSSMGHVTGHFVADGLNHFSILDELGRPDSDLVNRQLTLIGPRQS